MKTIEQVIARESRCPDHRDFARLGQFMTVEQLKSCGFEFDTPEHEAEHVPKDWTVENILKQLEEDVAFGFEKALDKRGLSAQMMLECVRMWLFALEAEGYDDFMDDTKIAEKFNMYGLPLFKKVAVQYGWPNPIGDDTGTETKYDAAPRSGNEALDNLLKGLPPELREFLQGLDEAAYDEQNAAIDKAA